MLQNMTLTTIEKPTTTRSVYGESIITWEACSSAYVFVTYAATSQRIQNQVAINEVTHIGLTEDKTIEKGWRLAGKYIVLYVIEAGRFNQLYLQEVK